LGKTLGSGAFSKVKYATDTTTGTPWAIKIMSKELIKKENMEDSIKREIAIMSKLKNLHIVELKEVLTTDTEIYLVLELVTGGELLDKIVSAKRFDENRARRYFQQLIQAIQYCHENGVAHRDLKPENLLLDNNDIVKISDFGLSSLTSSGTKKTLMTCCGTPNYVAPEVLEEKGYDGFKADIWSCGVILYTMLAGYLPFEDESMNGLFDKIQKGIFEYPDFFSKDVKTFISKMLVVNPKKRITIQEILVEPWFAVGYNKQEVKKIDESKDFEMHSAKLTKEDGDGDKSKGVVDHPLDAFELFNVLTIDRMGLLLSSNASINKETQFIASIGAKEMKVLLENKLREINAKPTPKNEYAYKVIWQKGSQAVQFSIELLPIHGDVCHVLFKRGKGEILDFNAMYNLLLSKLQSSKVIQKAATKKA